MSYVFCSGIPGRRQVDGRWSRDALLANLSAAASLGPLNVGPVIELDTSQPVDVGALWKQIQAATNGR